jgi:hypothetical protein
MEVEASDCTASSENYQPAPKRTENEPNALKKRPKMRQE